MKAMENGLTSLYRPRRGHQLGFTTLVSAAVSTLVSGVVLTGIWMGYCSMLKQWKVVNADRQMDQYAAAAMQELTNVISWSWGAKQIGGGIGGSRWQFLMEDQVEEYGPMRQWKYGRIRDLQHFLELTYQPYRGILWHGQPPRWAVEANGTPYYLWRGGSPTSSSTKAFDGRDQMTMESLWLDLNQHEGYEAPNQSLNGRAKWSMVIKIDMVMHYSYHSSFRSVGLYGDTYVREREYQTQIAMRNWDVESNWYFDQVTGKTTATTGSTGSGG
jgi:hypothetical protein